jgi:DNA-binding CsgD family transcriptional regulator
VGVDVTMRRQLEHDVRQAEATVASCDAALVAGDVTGARAQLRAALELFRRAGDRYGQMAAAGAGPDAVGVGLGVGPDGHPEVATARQALQVLTRRERQVAELVGTGLTNRQIGEQITIAERTVDTHVQRILAKLNCSSRVQVAVMVTTSQHETS